MKKSVFLSVVLLSIVSVATANAVDICSSGKHCYDPSKVEENAKKFQNECKNSFIERFFGCDVVSEKRAKQISDEIIRRSITPSLTKPRIPPTEYRHFQDQGQMRSKSSR